MKFTRKIAKEIARNQFKVTLDSIMGRTGICIQHHLRMSMSELKIIFSVELEVMNISATTKRTDIIYEYYSKMANKAIKVVERLYPKHK